MVSPLLGQWGTRVDPFRGFFINDDGLEAAPMDWRETRDAHAFYVDLPGLSREDVKLELVPDQGVLRITVETNEPDEEGNKNVKWHCRERLPRGSGYLRQFRLPNNAKADDIKASMRDGVLTVIVPKEKKGHHEKKDNNTRCKKAVEIATVDADHDRSNDSKDHKRSISRFVCCKA